MEFDVESRFAFELCKQPGSVSTIGYGWNFYVGIWRKRLENAEGEDRSEYQSLF